MKPTRWKETTMSRGASSAIPTRRRHDQGSTAAPGAMIAVPGAMTTGGRP